MLTLNRTGAETFVLTKDGEGIGGIVLQNGSIASFWVDAAWRRKGYGTYALRQLRRALPNTVLTMTLAPDNATGAAFLRAMQFTCTAQSEEGILYTYTPGGLTQAVAASHAFLRSHVTPGAFVLDATAGNGHDTLLLATWVGDAGSVLAMDIQPQAIAATRARLAQHGVLHRVQLACDSHANLAQYLGAQALDAAVFNLGYLPGAAHTLFTTPDVSVPAIQTALARLKPGGVCTLCLYAGGAQKTQERDAVLRLAETLPQAEFTVTLCGEVLPPPCPPVALCIRKLML